MSNPSSLLVLLGSQSGLGGKGIYQVNLDVKTGSLNHEKCLASLEKASFICRQAQGPLVFSVGDDGTTKTSGNVFSFRYDGSAETLTQLDKSLSFGKGPCHISTDRKGEALYVANYSSGSYASYVLPKEGQFLETPLAFTNVGKSVHPTRQKSAHTHSVKVDPANRFALVCDLGLDQVFSVSLDSMGMFEDQKNAAVFKARPGAGPRHLDFSPNGKWVVIANELDCTISLCSYDPMTGVLTEKQALSALKNPEGLSNQTLSEVAFHPNGKWVYTALRAKGQIILMSLEESTETLKYQAAYPSGGLVPRHFALDPSGSFLLCANEDSGLLTSFGISKQTGVLSEPLGQVKIPGVSCVLFY